MGNLSRYVKVLEYLTVDVISIWLTLLKKNCLFSSQRENIGFLTTSRCHDIECSPYYPLASPTHINIILTFVDNFIGEKIITKSELGILI